MIDNYLWEELATFAEQKALAKTAEVLHVTQPTITRGMQKLEDLLNVELFIRQPNHIQLTKTGELAAKEAQKIVVLNQQAEEKIFSFYQSQQTINISFTLPGPRILLHSLSEQLPQNVQLENQLQQGNLSELLVDRKFSLLLSNQEIFDEQITSELIGVEQLAVNLNQFMYQASQTSITFKDLKKMSFLVLDDIGPWKDLIQNNIPDTKFLYLDQAETLSEISSFSDFPFFSTNISSLNPHFKQQNQEKHSRVTIPISDRVARVPVYANFLKNQKQTLKPIIDLLLNNWPSIKF